MNHLSKRMTNFVAAYLELNEAKAAAVKAGYSPSTAHRASQKLMKNPLIQGEIEKERNKIRERTTYNVEKLIAKTEKAIEFAYANKNAMAAIKGTELIGKLTGLLIERQHVQTETLDLRAALSPRQQLQFMNTDVQNLLIEDHSLMAEINRRLVAAGKPTIVDAEFAEVKTPAPGKPVDIFED